MADKATVRTPILWIVIPCYNEAAVLPLTAPLFSNELGRLIRSGRAHPSSRVCLVDDGSTDETWHLIEGLALQDGSLFCGISLSRNMGHQNALFAGLMEAVAICDVSISMDCDGQDDISICEKMLAAYDEGADIVYGVRSDRQRDSFFKRTTAHLFYRFMDAMGTETIYNHADCRLMSRRALEALSLFPERSLFLRGLVPLLGFPSATVTYERETRVAGTSHYPLRKMVHLALNGITSLSVKPIRIITSLGFLVSLIGLGVAIWSLVMLALGNTVAGWTSSICISCILGGVQLVSLGVIGEYIGKMYLDIKQRPRFIIAARTTRTESTESESTS